MRNSSYKASRYSTSLGIRSCPREGKMILRRAAWRSCHYAQQVLGQPGCSHHATNSIVTLIRMMPLLNQQRKLYLECEFWDVLLLFLRCKPIIVTNKQAKVSCLLLPSIDSTSTSANVGFCDPLGFKRCWSVYKVGWRSVRDPATRRAVQWDEK